MGTSKPASLRQGIHIIYVGWIKRFRLPAKRAGAERRALARGPGGRQVVGLATFLLFLRWRQRVFNPITAAGDGYCYGVV